MDHERKPCKTHLHPRNPKATRFFTLTNSGLFPFCKWVSSKIMLTRGWKNRKKPAGREPTKRKRLSIFNNTTQRKAFVWISKLKTWITIQVSDKLPRSCSATCGANLTKPRSKNSSTTWLFTSSWTQTGMTSDTLATHWGDGRSALQTEGRERQPIVEHEHSCCLLHHLLSPITPILEVLIEKGSAAVSCEANRTTEYSF